MPSGFIPVTSHCPTRINVHNGWSWSVVCWVCSLLREFIVFGMLRSWRCTKYWYIQVLSAQPRKGLDFYKELLKRGTRHAILGDPLKPTKPEASLMKHINEACLTTQVIPTYMLTKREDISRCHSRADSDVKIPNISKPIPCLCTFKVLY